MRQTAVLWSLCLGMCLLVAGTAAAESQGAGARGSDSQRQLVGVPAGFPGTVADADFYDDGEPDPRKVELGRLLFYDKILSGNLNISCASCHHSLTDTGDGLSLPVGEGGIGLGVTRTVGHGVDRVEERVPRNAPPVFNLGAREFERMFFDGRVELLASHPQVFRSPAGDDLPDRLDNVLAAQAMFPVTSATEMAGQEGENPQADHAASKNLPALWDFIAGKLRAVPEYVDLFVGVYGDDPEMPVASADDISYVHAANAIAAFEAVAWRADDSAFDRHLRGEAGVLSARQNRGMQLFFGEAGCSSCHSDPSRRAAIEASCELEPMQLSEFDIDCLLDFLAALTDRSSLDLRRDVPFEVPSGLAVFD